MLPVSLSCTGVAFALVGRHRKPTYINTPDAPASLRGGASCIHGVGGLSLDPKIVGVGGRGYNWGFFMALTD